MALTIRGHSKIYNTLLTEVEKPLNKHFLSASGKYKRKFNFNNDLNPGKKLAYRNKVLTYQYFEPLQSPLGQNQL